MEAILKFKGAFQGLVLAATMLAGCATSNWFRPVSPAASQAKIYCGTEGPQAQSVVVSVYVDEPVEQVAFTVQPLPESGSHFDHGYRRRDGVTLPGKTATCVRVPLPTTMGDVHLFNVAVHGHAGSAVRFGGEMACEPQPIAQLDCEIL